MFNETSVELLNEPIFLSVLSVLWRTTKVVDNKLYTGDLIYFLYK